MKKYIPYILILILTLSSCGPRFYAKKAKKAIAKAIEKGAVIAPDTAWHTVPIISPEIEWQFDTKLFPEWQTHRLDSIPFKDEETGVEATVSVELNEGCPEDCIKRLRLAGKIPTDTIIVRVPHTITQNITVPVKDNKWKWIAIGLGVVLIASIALKKLL